MTADLKYLSWATVRQLPKAALTAVICGSAIIGMLMLLPEKHTATALILVEGSSMSPSGTASSDAQTDAAHLQNIENRLMTQARITHLNSDLGLDQNADAFRRATQFDVVSGRGKATTLTITFSASDPATAASATNLLAENVLEEHRKIRTKQADDALQFFRREVADSKATLDTKLTKLVAFRTANAGQMTEDAAQLVKQRDQMLGQISATPEPWPSSEQEEKLRAEIKAAKTIYSDQHPKVQMLLAKLNARVSVAQPTSATNPILAERLTQINATLAAIPANELRFKALQRDHDIAETQYETAVKRLEAAAIQERIALRDNGDRLSIVERASAPDLAAHPKKRIAMAIGLAFSVLAGAVVGVMRARADPYLRRPSDLKVGLGLIPYAVIPAAIGTT